MLSFQAATSQSGAFPDSFGTPVETIEGVPDNWDVYRIKPAAGGSEYCAAMTRDNGLLAIFRADVVDAFNVDLVELTRSSLMTELRSSEAPYVTVMVDQSHEWTINGVTKPDSILLELTPDWVPAMQDGNELSFESEDGKRLFVSLSGSRPALDALLECQEHVSRPPESIATEDAEPAPAQADEGVGCKLGPDVEAVIKGCSAIIDAGVAAVKNIADALTNRGSVYYVTRDYRRAIDDFDRALALDPDNPTAHLFRGRSYHSTGDYDRAIDDYSATIAVFPDAEHHYFRGNAYLAKREFGKAIEDFDQAIAAEPTEPVYLNSRCWARAVAGTDLDLARADCDASLALSTEASTLDSRGLVGLKQGDFDKAWADYDAALQAGPSASYLYGRGYAAFRLGRKEDGEADIAAAVELDAGIADEYALIGVPPP
jgi:tetratricopeptide (TPR) repeat protein